MSGLTLLVSHTAIAQDEFASSFAGFGFDINGIRLDLPAKESFKAFDPEFYFKKGERTDSQGELVREDVGTQAFGRGHINSVRESYRVSVTPWHAGNLSYEVMRDVGINRDDKKPTIADFVAATKAKYGEPASELKKLCTNGAVCKCSTRLKTGRLWMFPASRPM